MRALEIVGTVTTSPKLSQSFGPFINTTSESIRSIQGSGTNPSGAKVPPVRGLSGAGTLPSSVDYSVTIGPVVVASRNPSEIVIGSITLSLDGSAYTTEMYTISLASSSILNIDGSTTSLPAIFPNLPGSTSTATTGTVTSTMTMLRPDLSMEVINKYLDHHDEEWPSHRCSSPLVPPLRTTKGRRPCDHLGLSQTPLG